MVSFSIVAFNSGISLVIALAPLAIYLGDVLSTIGQRTLKRKSLFEAHRDHAYQRLVRLGLSHQVVALLVSGFTIMAAGFALVGYRFQIHAGVVALLLAVLICAYLSLPSIVARLKRQRQSERS